MRSGMLCLNKTYKKKLLFILLQVVSPSLHPIKTSFRLNIYPILLFIVFDLYFVIIASKKLSDPCT